MELMVYLRKSFVAVLNFGSCARACMNDMVSYSRCLLMGVTCVCGRVVPLERKARCVNDSRAAASLRLLPR